MLTRALPVLSVSRQTYGSVGPRSKPRRERTQECKVAPPLLELGTDSCPLDGCSTTKVSRPAQGRDPLAATGGLLLGHRHPNNVELETQRGAH
jgi:hypothetical protein